MKTRNLLLVVALIIVIIGVSVYAYLSLPASRNYDSGGKLVAWKTVDSA